MSDLTPEAARAAAEWLDQHAGRQAARALRTEADRMEAAARTPGQVAWNEWCEDHGNETAPARMDRVAAAVIAHHVGPDRVVVERSDATTAADHLERHGHMVTAGNIREALS